MLVVVLFVPIPGWLIGWYTAIRHGMEALVYSNHPAVASSYLAIIFGRIASGIPWYRRSIAVQMQLSHQCRRWCKRW